MPDGSYMLERQEGARVIALPNVLSSERVDGYVPAGLTVAEIVALYLPDLARLPANCVAARVWITNAEMTREPELVPFEYWTRVRPIKGAVVTVRLVPLGGGGGGVLRSVLSLAVVAASFALPALAAAGTFGTALQSVASFGSFTIGSSTFAVGSIALGVATSFIGNMLVNAIAPPPSANLPDADVAGIGFSGSATTPTLSITGTQNRFNPYGPVPRVFGKVRVFPPLAAAQYTEIVGNDQYLRCLFDVGYGPLALSELSIGTIPLEQFEGVETDIRYGYAGDAPIGLYSNTVNEDSYSTRLRYNQPRILVTRPNCQEITADLTFNGLVTFGSDNSRQTRSVDILVEYRVSGSGGWTSLGTTTISAATDQAYRYAFRIPGLGLGQYDVRFTRLTPDNTSVLTRDDVSITALRSIQYTPPAVPAGHCLVALRIKATDQLNGVVKEFNCQAQALLPIWNGSTWSAPTATSNPAWAYCEVLRGAANKRPVPDAKIDLAAIKAWADDCAAAAGDGLPKFEFDVCLDQRSTIFQTLQMIASSARAAYGMKDDKHSIIVDRPQTTPRQLFTPRNSWGFKGRKTFVNPPDALKVRYIEPDRDWQQHEITVYNDGKDASTAALFETIEMVGVTRANQAWREGRFHFAVGKLRPETYEIFVDVENLSCNRGDLVHVANDVTRWGLGSGRVKSITTSGGNVLTITLDEELQLETGKSYSIRARLTSGDIVTIAIASVGATIVTKTLTLSTPTLVANAPAVGDLVAFGETSREIAPMIVKAKYPSGDHAARLELVDAAPAVHTADVGTIPAFDTGSTWPGQGVNLDPSPPAIVSIVSDESAMISTASGYVPAIQIVLGPRSGIVAASDVLSAQIRRQNSGESWRTFNFPTDASSIVLTPVSDGVVYDMRFRYVTASGRASKWVTQSGYTAIGRTTLPPDVTDFRIADTLIDGRLSGTTPLDFAGFVVRYNRGSDRNFATARLAHGPGGVVFPFDIAHLGTGPLTLFATGLDTAGNESATPATIYRDLGDPVVDNVVTTVNFGALNFPGTVTGGTLVLGELRANGDGGAYLASGDELYLSDGTAAYLTVAYEPISYEFSYTPSVDDVPSTLTLAVDTQGTGLTIDYQGDDGSGYLADDAAPYLPDGAAAYLPGVFGFINWPGSVDAAHIAFKFRVSLAGGYTQGKVFGAVLTLDVPDEEEIFADLSIAAGGTRLPLSKTYRSIRVVNLTLQSGAADSIKIIDKDATLGPLVRAFASGAGVAAIIDARIQGVKK